MKHPSDEIESLNESAFEFENLTPEELLLVSGSYFDCTVFSGPCPDFGGSCEQYNSGCNSLES